MTVGSSTYTITIQQTAHSTAALGEMDDTATDILKSLRLGSISAPMGLSSKTITFGDNVEQVQKTH